MQQVSGVNSLSASASCYKFLLPQRAMLGRQGMTQIFGNRQVLSMAIFKTGRSGARKQGQGVENPA